MSSPASFEVLLEVSRALDDGFIDEDIAEIHKGNRNPPVSNRTITVRGKRRGRGLVLTYQDYYSTSISPRVPALYEREILEVFAAQPRLSFEGTCRRRSRLDRLARVFGAGGSKGSHAIFERLRLDAEGAAGEASFHQPGFAAALEQLARRRDVQRVLLQAEAGLTAVVRWSGRGSSAAFVLGLVEAVVGVAATLDITRCQH